MGGIFLAKKGKMGQNDPFWAPKTGIVTGNSSWGGLVKTEKTQRIHFLVGLARRAEILHSILSH